MKRIVLLFIPALICGVVFSSCSSDKAGLQDEKTMGELYVIGTRSATVTTGDKTDLVFTGDDIKSYNVNTGEIAFVESKLEVIKSRLGLWSQLEFFIDEMPVFVPPIWIHSPLSSAGAGDLNLRLGGPDFDKIYFAMWFNSWEWLPEAERKIKQKEDDEIAKKRKKELEVFIEYLNDAGKIDDTVPPEVVVPTDPNAPVVIDSLNIK